MATPVMQRIAFFSWLAITAMVFLLSNASWYSVSGADVDPSDRIEFWVTWGSLYVSLLLCTFVGFATYRLARTARRWVPVGILLYVVTAFLATAVPNLAVQWAYHHYEPRGVHVFYGDAGMIPLFFGIGIQVFAALLGAALMLSFYLGSREKNRDPRRIT